MIERLQSAKERVSKLKEKFQEIRGYF